MKNFIIKQKPSWGKICDFFDKHNLPIQLNLFSPPKFSYRHNLEPINSFDGVYNEFFNEITMFRVCQRKNGTMSLTAENEERLNITCIHELLHMIFTTSKLQSENGNEITEFQTGINYKVYRPERALDVSKAHIDFFHSLDEAITEYLACEIYGAHDSHFPTRFEPIKNLPIKNVIEAMINHNQKYFAKALNA